MIQQTEQPAFYEGRTHATAEEVGYDPARLEALDAHLLGLIQQTKLQGAGYLLARDGRIFAHKAAGKLTNRADSPDLMPDSIRKTYSATKFFTAVAILQLVEDGLLYIDQPVASLLHEFDTPLHKGITVFHLLTHTSGVYPDPGSSFEPYPTAWFEGVSGYDSWIQAVLSGPLPFKPGEQFGYSTAGYAVLGELISRVSGMPYETYIIRRIAEPLGMTRTFFEVPAHLHDEVCFTGDWEEEGFRAQRDRTGRPPRAGNGLYSTLDDLWKLGQMMLNGGSLDGVRVLSRKSVEAMTKNVLSNVRYGLWGEQIADYKFGLGLNVKTPTIETPGTYGHEGFGRCGVQIDPIERFVAVFIVPTGIQWAPESVINTKSIMWSGLI